MTNELIAAITVFVVTLGDHAGVPNIYVIAMVLAKGKEFHFSTLFASAFVSVIVYEQALYWFARWLNRHKIREYRVIGDLIRRAESVSKLVSDKSGLWLIFGRFVALVGLYVPFAAGQMKRRWTAFSLASAFGTTLQLLAFGVPAYLLGDYFEEHVKRIPLVWISVGIMLIVVVSQAFVRLRRSKARRSLGEPPLDQIQGHQPDNR